ncbi:Nif3-like dinuclear metal center hexameric protein [Robiginitalea sp. IMCC43444]|uniref:Nif3-like dinuclear metal center hexameric protein n=1 Tax=Robiginitalea sp. IMCC43444 TaxID=3459121 RepID=UPI004042EF80
MTIKDVTNQLEELAPLSYAEDFDNVGLLVGQYNTEVTGILVTLDTLEAVIDEAVQKQCNLIVSFHPIIFRGLKKLRGDTYVERAILKAIKNNIAIYSMHTALDNVREGVNGKICEILGLKNNSILIPKKGVIRKLVTYVPESHTDSLLEGLFEAGAGNIGNYSNCSFRSAGQGSFTPGPSARPAVGKPGIPQLENEIRLDLTFSSDRQTEVLQALFNHHPYEEVAYELYTLDNAHQLLGMGMLGELEKPLETVKFLELLKKQMNVSVIRHSQLLSGTVRKVAVLGGSGAFAIGPALAAGADILVTSDLKYHDFFTAEGKIVLADIGHYETEQFTKNLLVDYLRKKIPNFAISLSETKTNPINYF